MHRIPNAQNVFAEVITFENRTLNTIIILKNFSKYMTSEVMIKLMI